MNGQYDPRKHHRRSIRRKGWDYRWPGAYFVTICTQERADLFENDAFRDVVENAWRAIPKHDHAQHVQLDEWIVMPNHLHGIIIIDMDHVGARQAGNAVELQTGSANRPASPPPAGTNDGLQNDVANRPASPPSAGMKVESQNDAADRPASSALGGTSASESCGAMEEGARQVGLDGVGGFGDSIRPASPLRDGADGVQPGSIGAIVGNFKSLTARRINNLRRTPGAKVWQRGYYDRIVRNERELNAIRRYIVDNPRRWAEDRENLERLTARMRLVTA